MVQPVNNDLPTILGTIKNFFYETRQTGLAVSQLQHVKPPYFSAVKTLNELSGSSWDQLIEDLSSLQSVYRIRSITTDTMTCLKAFLFMDTFSNGGICLHLSFLGNYIGYTFIQSGEFANTKPVKVYADGGFNNNVSYFPYTEDLNTFEKLITQCVKKHFPAFSDFPKEYADFKVAAIQTQEAYFEHIDLFQVIFTPNLTEFF